MQALVLSRVYCEQLRVKTRRLIVEIITPCVVGKVRGTFFVDAAGSVLYRVSLSLEAPNYCLCIQSTSTSTLWEKYSRNWRNAFKCAWM